MNAPVIPACEKRETLRTYCRVAAATTVAVGFNPRKTTMRMDRVAVGQKRTAPQNFTRWSDRYAVHAPPANRGLKPTATVVAAATRHTVHSPLFRAFT